MGLIAKLFGSDKVIDAGISGIDKMFYTDEEKADAKMHLLKLYEPFKLAQRYLALVFGVPYSVAWFVTFCASFFVDTSKQMELLSGDMAMIVGVIVAFYFAGGMGNVFKK